MDRIKAAMKGQESEVIDKTSGSSLTYFTLAVLVTILIVCIIILASVPPVCRDSLTHHLAVPKLYLIHGGMYEIPSVIFSYYPMNLELLYLIPLYFGNDIVPKFIHFLFAFLTAILVYGYLKKRTDRVFALFGSLFFLSIPVIIKLSITVYVDLGLIFFSTGSIIFMFKWIESDFRLKHLFISAVLCGLALGTKYNALIVFFILTMFVMLSSSRVIPGKNAKAAIKPFLFGIFYIFIALAVFSPWMIRNYAWTKNPVYPLYQGFFSRIDSGVAHTSQNMVNDSDNETIKNRRAGKWSNFAIRRIIYKESFTQILLIPVRIFFEGEDGNPKYFDGKLSPFLFVLPLFAFLFIKEDNHPVKTEKRILLLFSVLFILFAFAETDMRIRYISPVIPPLVMLSVMGLHNLFSFFRGRYLSFSGGLSSLCLGLFFTVIIISSAVYITEQFRFVDPAGYLRGKVTRDEYIERYRPEYAALKFANNNISNDAKILGFFLGNRRYYSDREMLFNETILIDSIRSSDAPDKIVSDIKKKGITHFLVWYGMFDNWVNNNFDENEKVLLSKLFKEKAILLFSKGGYGLFELK